MDETIWTLSGKELAHHSIQMLKRGYHGFEVSNLRHTSLQKKNKDKIWGFFMINNFLSDIFWKMKLIVIARATRHWRGSDQ
jgi:hypothetical protein